MTEEICSSCWYDKEIIIYNVNGKCDNCGGVVWIDPGEFDPELIKMIKAKHGLD